jgi:hypothetical protein
MAAVRAGGETETACGQLLAAGDSLEQHELLCRPNWSDGERDWSNGGHEEEMFSVGAGTKKTGQHATAENVPRVPSIDIIRCAAAACPTTPLRAGPL